MFWNVWISFFTVVEILEFYNGAFLGLYGRHGTLAESMGRNLDRLAERTVTEDFHAVVFRNVASFDKRLDIDFGKVALGHERIDDA